MNEFEQELRDELQDFDLPAGFAERVMERVRKEQRETRMGLWRRATAAVVLLAAGAGAWGAHQHQQEQCAKAVQARREFTVAMRITAKSLDDATAVLERIETNAAQMKEENQ